MLTSPVFASSIVRFPSLPTNANLPLRFSVRPGVPCTGATCNRAGGVPTTGAGTVVGNAPGLGVGVAEPHAAVASARPNSRTTIFKHNDDLNGNSIRNPQ